MTQTNNKTFDTPLNFDLLEYISQHSNPSSNIKISSLLQSLNTENKNIRYSIAEQLKRYGNSVIASLIDELANRNSSIRLCVIETLGHIGDQTAINCLTQIIADKNEDQILREYAVYALEKLGEKGKESLITILQQLSDTKAIAPLTGALYADDEKIRTLATKKITELRIKNQILFYEDFDLERMNTQAGRTEKNKSIPKIKPNSCLTRELRNIKSYSKKQQKEKETHFTNYKQYLITDFLNNKSK